jgi:hypothetical protein
MYTGNKKIDSFLDVEIKECIFHGIKVDLADVKYLNHGNFGTFDEDTLRTAIKNPVKKWLPVFVHESCHKDQFLERDEIWNTHIKGVDAIHIMNAWLGKTCELTENQLKTVIAKVQKVEIDCEKRAVKKIRKYDLPIDIDKYIKEANAYLWYFHGVAKSRKWSCGDFLQPKILKLMPTHFRNNYDKPPKNYLELLLS